MRKKTKKKIFWSTCSQQLITIFRIRVDNHEAAQMKALEICFRIMKKFEGGVGVGTGSNFTLKFWEHKICHFFDFWSLTRDKRLNVWKSIHLVTVHTLCAFPVTTTNCWNREKSWNFMKNHKIKNCHFWFLKAL